MIPKKYEKKKSLVVKVQIPIMSNEDEPLAMVYNKSRDFDVMMRITDELLEEMGDEFKAFFYAHYDRKNNNTVLEGRAPWQKW